MIWLINLQYATNFQSFGLYLQAYITAVHFTLLRVALLGTDLTVAMQFK